MRLFRVVRKSVTPKLSASKLHPPSLTVSPMSLPSSTASSSHLEAIPPLPDFATQIDPRLVRLVQEADAAPQKGPSRPATPKRPTTPKRPIIPKRPSTAREISDRQTENGTSVWEASESPSKGRPRATSYSNQARPSTATRKEWNVLVPPAGSRAIKSQALESGGTTLSQREPSRLSIRPHIVPPSVPQGTMVGGKIVPNAQIQTWMSQVSTTASPPLAPRRRGAARPVGRPSTADTTGRHWPMI